VNILRHIIEPGFFGSGPVHIALAVGTVVAITSAVTGVFTVTRGQSFAGTRWPTSPPPGALAPSWWA
jgi:hypothetical protein